MRVLNSLSKNTHLTSSTSGSNNLLFVRKSSTQSNKISKIILSPTNRTLLKPRKGAKGMNTDRIKQIGNKEESTSISKQRAITTSNIKFK